MNRGVLQSSPVQQMMARNPNNWWNINTMRPPPPPPQASPPFFSTPSNFLTPYYTPTSSLPLPSWHDNNQELPESWSQLLMSGMVSEEEKGGMCQIQSKKLENWEQQMLSQAPSAPIVDVKQESSVNSYVYGHGTNEEFQAAKPITWSQIVPASSPKSCVTSFSSSMLDFSNNNADARPPPPDPSSECNSSTATGGAFKKAESQLQVGFYSNTCPQVDSIIRAVVRDAVLSDPNMAAVLLRLHFHDCFAQGCDGSILIENGPQSERHAFGHQGVRGFEVIERAKAQLEGSCPGLVSCADIVALAARDAVVMANGPAYQVPTGRRDGLVSNLSLADDMPDVSDSIELLKTKFLNKGLTVKDLVLLSGAHTIGTTACFFMTRRLYNFFPSGEGSDPAIRQNFLPRLKARCPQNGDVNIRLAIDEGSEQKFDINILKNIREGFAVLESDARLNDDIATKNVIDSYVSPFSPMFGPSFEADFVESVVKMGQIGVKTGFLGEIRRVCSAFN